MGRRRWARSDLDKQPNGRDLPRIAIGEAELRNMSGRTRGILRGPETDFVAPVNERADAVRENFEGMVDTLQVAARQ